MASDFKIGSMARSTHRAGVGVIVALLGLALCMDCFALPASAAGFGGGHSGGAAAGGFIGAGRVGPVKGYAPGRFGKSRPVSQPQIVSRAGMNRQLVLPGDRSDPGRFYGRSLYGVSRNGFYGGQRINRDRYGNAYGFGLGAGYGYYGAGSYGYASSGNAAIQPYGYQSDSGGYGGAEPASFPYAPPRIIEIRADNADEHGSGAHARQNRTQRSGPAGVYRARSSLPVVTYGPSFGSRASVGPGPYADAGGQDLFAPRVVRVRVPRG